LTLATRKQFPGELLSSVAAIPLNIIGEAYMSLPVGKAIYLIAFNLPLSYIRKLTDQPATRKAYSLFLLIVLLYVNIYMNIWFFQIFIRIFAPVFKNNV
jgi:hypothetical protein